MVTVKLIASKPLEHKVLKIDTNIAKKFWSSIISISRVSAGNTVNYSVFANCM